MREEPMKRREQLQRDVQDELKWEPALDEAGIGVSVEDGAVTLTGHVSTYSEKTAAERATKRVHGVHAVANDLVVKLPSSKERDDTDIAEAAARALQWRSDVPSDAIKAVITKGWVTLEGNVEWYFQKQAAYDAIRHLSGVKGVTNNVAIKPRASAFQVKEKIQDAFRRSAEIDAKRVQADVQDSKVILRGTVRSWAEREDAESAAWAAPGVSKVESHIAVEEEELVS
jgi:osmotically-inducible protein OsmY